MRWHHTARELCSSWRRNTVKHGRAFLEHGDCGSRWKHRRSAWAGATNMARWRCAGSSNSVRGSTRPAEDSAQRRTTPASLSLVVEKRGRRYAHKKANLVTRTYPGPLEVCTTGYDRHRDADHCSTGTAASDTQESRPSFSDGSLHEQLFKFNLKLPVPVPLPVALAVPHCATGRVDQGLPLAPPA